MLKYIKVRNFLSFKDETEINFESSNYGGKSENVFNIKGLGKKLLFQRVGLYIEQIPFEKLIF